MKTFLRDNGLTIALGAMFLFCALGMIWSGFAAHNEELREHGAAAIGLSAYLASGAFLSALFENWESEFLQMSAYVMLTAVLFQRGSAESRDPDDPDRPGDELAPAMRKSNPALSWIYSHSLGVALAGLFLISFALHWWASLAAVNEETLRHGGEAQSLGSYLFDAQLWFESMQNWQSEFLSTAVLVVLSIFLRHKGSPESKPTGAPNSKTGAYSIPPESRIQLDSDPRNSLPRNLRPPRQLGEVNAGEPYGHPYPDKTRYIFGAGLRKAHAMKHKALPSVLSGRWFRRYDWFPPRIRAGQLALVLAWR